MKVTQISVYVGRKIPQPQIGPYHMAEFGDTWTVDVEEGEDPNAVAMQVHMMIAATLKEVCLPLIKAAMPVAQAPEGAGK